MNDTGSFVDMHNHTLYSMDDGPASPESMKRMLDAAARDGVGTIIATPHVSPGRREFHYSRYCTALQEANAYCKASGYSIAVLGGAEVFYTEAAVRLLRSGCVPTLNGTRFVLVEWSDSESFGSITDGIRAIANAGYIPVIAHVERLRSFRHRLDRWIELRNAFDMRIQIDCAAVLHPRLLIRSTLARAHETGLIDYVASDAHDTDSRGTRMTDTYRELVKGYGSAYADAVMRENQRELLAP